MGMLEQPASETLVHKVMAMCLLRCDDTIITSHKHNKQRQSLPDKVIKMLYYTGDTTTNC